MQEDTVFWQKNTHAYALFEELRIRADKNAYDDDFLAQLAAYRTAALDSECADIFAARYLLAHNLLQSNDYFIVHFHRLPQKVH